MANNNIENSLSYKICYLIGALLGKSVRGFFILLWNGTGKAIKNNKYIAVIYAFLSVMIIIAYTVYQNVSIMFLILLITIIVLGIYESIREYPLKKRRMFFHKLFEEMKLQANDDTVPYYLYEREISEFATAITFASIIPLSEWLSKKELLETYMNVKIIDIKQDEENYRIIDVIVQLRNLPKTINWTDEFLNRKSNVLNIGIGYYGVVGMDLEKYPHAFVAGETGSGKSNILKCMIHQSLMKDYEVLLIDYKRGVSFSIFKDAVDIYYEDTTILEVLKDTVRETNKRLDLFRESGVDNINDYNRFTTHYLRRKVVFIDELAELLKNTDKEIAKLLNGSIETLTRLSRATGIHLVMGVQRPDSTIISGQIKNNVSYRVCGRFADKEPSGIVLNNTMACSLPPNIKGRVIVKDNDLQVVQSFCFSGNRNDYTRKVRSALQPVKPMLIETREMQEEILQLPKLNEPAPAQSSKRTSDFEFDFSDIPK
jgi:S-DNA-T family DNA segregation ATPase FtsK/SpoIIIE